MAATTEEITKSGSLGSVSLWVATGSPSSFSPIYFTDKLLTVIHKENGSFQETSESSKEWELQAEQGAASTQPFPATLPPSLPAAVILLLPPLMEMNPAGLHKHTELRRCHKSDLCLPLLDFSAFDAGCRTE